VAVAAWLVSTSAVVVIKTFNEKSKPSAKSNAKSDAPKVPTVAAEQATLQKLNARLTALAISQKKLLIERKQISSAALADEDPKASERLTQICKTPSEQGHLLDSVGDAIKETEARIAAAKDRDSHQQRVEVARGDLAKLDELKTLARRIDGSLESAFGDITNFLSTLGGVVQRNGARAPTIGLVRSLTGRARQSSKIARLIDGVGMLGPSERKNFEGLAESWGLASKRGPRPAFIMRGAK
jgi:hypothetical protein